jgi:hypothetical protein
MLMNRSVIMRGKHMGLRQKLLSLLLTEEGPDPLPRTVGQAILLQVCELLKEHPIDMHELLHHITGGPDGQPVKGALVEALETKGFLTKVTSVARPPFSQLKDALHPFVLEVIMKCVKGEGLDMRLDDWPQAA